MKATTAAVIDLINAARAAPDAPIAFAECFTFITTTGAQYTWTTVDYPVTYNGYTFSASGPLVSGLKYKGSVGLEVDKQQITIAARPTDTINGAPFLIALRNGAFDGAPVYRDRVFLAEPMGSVVGGVRMFQGRVSTVESVGRTQAVLTIASDLVILDYDMPRNLFSPTCLHTLYDTGCGVIRGTYSVNGTAGAGSTSSEILFSGALAEHAQGSLVWTSAPTPTCGRRFVRSRSAPDSTRSIRRHLRRLRGTPSRSPPVAITRKRPARAGLAISQTFADSPTCRRRRWLTSSEIQRRVSRE